VIRDRAAEDQLVAARRGDEIGEPRMYRPGRAPDEINDPAVRAVKLREWIDLPRHVYARLEDGTRVRHAFDPRQLGADRVSSVQYLKFPVGGRVPVGFGIDLPQLTEETTLTSEQRRALEADVVPDR
jgi:hypothetical protein